MAKKQKSGLYRSKVKIGVDANGKDINKWISGKTKKELDEARQQVISQYITGEGLAGDQLFGTYCERWYHARIEPSVALATRKLYLTTLNKHILPVFGDRNLRSIKSMDIQEYINGYAGKSASLINQIMITLHGVFHSAIVDRIIGQDPTAFIVKPPAAKPLKRRALTPEETAALLPLMDSTVPGLFLAVLYYLGLRTGEARGLQWGDFDFENNFVHIQRDVDSVALSAPGALKTPTADRFIPVPRQLKSLLLPVRDEPEVFLFHSSDGQPIKHSSIYHIWILTMVRAGLAEPIVEPKYTHDIHGLYRCAITPYYLRHNYITMCFNANINPLIVQRLVGHKNYSTTANVYTHVSRDNLTVALSIFD